MTEQSSPATIVPSGRRVAALYAVPLLVMVGAWTIVHYVDQPYRSPTYRRTLLECLGYAAWVAPVEGAGPLVPVPLVVVQAVHRPELFTWVGPLVGGSVYLLFAAFASRVGRRWQGLSHVLLGFGWLMAGAVVFTRLTMK